VHLELRAVVLGENDVHGRPGNVEGAFQLVDHGERESALLVRRPPAAKVGIEESDAARGIAGAAEHQHVVGAGVHHLPEVLHDGVREARLLKRLRREVQIGYWAASQPPTSLPSEGRAG